MFIDETWSKDHHDPPVAAWAPRRSRVRPRRQGSSRSLEAPRETFLRRPDRNDRPIEAPCLSSPTMGPLHHGERFQLAPMSNSSRLVPDAGEPVWAHVVILDNTPAPTRERWCDVRSPQRRGASIRVPMGKSKYSLRTIKDPLSRSSPSSMKTLASCERRELRSYVKPYPNCLRLKILRGLNTHQEECICKAWTSGTQRSMRKSAPAKAGTKALAVEMRRRVEEERVPMQSAGVR